jgi:hypothetical protein
MTWHCQPLQRRINDTKYVPKWRTLFAGLVPGSKGTPGGHLGAPGTKDPAEVSQLSGNSANAELAAKEHVSAVCVSLPLLLSPMQAAGLRSRFFNHKSIHLSRYLVDGLVGNNNQLNPPRVPLTASCWGIVYSSEHIYLGEGAYVAHLSKAQLINFSPTVMAFYTKEAGAGSRHAWQLSTTSIASLSYIVVRAYEGISNCNSFWSIHSARANLLAHTLLHLSSTQFLCRTQVAPITSSPGILSLSDGDWCTFREMVNCKKTLATVIQAFNVSMRGLGKDS